MELFVGVTLTEARKARKITLKKIAQDTKISQKYLQALEEENYAIFPAEVYLKGFLRTYGRYLHLDTDQLVQAYEQQQRRNEPVNVPVKEKKSALPDKTSRQLLWLAGLALLLLVLIIIIIRNKG
jgi:cytoskeletal protein RodZ